MVLRRVLTDWNEWHREANAKAQRLLRFSQGQETSELASQPTIGRVSGKAEHRFPQRESRQPSQVLKPSVDNAQLDTMETEALGEDFSDTEAIVGTCDDMCSGSFSSMILNFHLVLLSFSNAVGPRSILN